MTSARDISGGMVQFTPETVPKDLTNFRNIARSWCVGGQRDVPGRPHRGPVPEEDIVSIFVHRKKLGAVSIAGHDGAAARLSSRQVNGCLTPRESRD
jgi:hypothetical protein